MVVFINLQVGVVLLNGCFKTSFHLKFINQPYELKSNYLQTNQKQSIFVIKIKRGWADWEAVWPTRTKELYE